MGILMTEVVLVLMMLEPDTERDVLRQLQVLPHVAEAHFLYGPYDAYVKAEAKTTAELENLVLNNIRSIKGVRSTTTCFIAD
jgi:DNA-binding Lrp family transcriptional regulator